MCFEIKRKEMSDMFAASGLNNITLKLSQEIDIMVAIEQRKRLDEWKKQ